MAGVDAGSSHGSSRPAPRVGLGLDSGSATGSEGVHAETPGHIVATRASTAQSEEVGRQRLVCGQPAIPSQRTDEPPACDTSNVIGLAPFRERWRRRGAWRPMPRCGGGDEPLPHPPAPGGARGRSRLPRTPATTPPTSAQAWSQHVASDGATLQTAPARDLSRR